MPSFVAVSNSSAAMFFSFAARANAKIILSRSAHFMISILPRNAATGKFPMGCEIYLALIASSVLPKDRGGLRGVALASFDVREQGLGPDYPAWRWSFMTEELAVILIRRDPAPLGGTLR